MLRCIFSMAKTGDKRRCLSVLLACAGLKKNAGFNKLSESCWRSPGVHTTRPMWTQNWMKADQMAWPQMGKLKSGSLECWPMEAFLAMLVLAAGRLVGWPSHVADDSQAKPAGLPAPSSILAVPSLLRFSTSCLGHVRSRMCSACWTGVTSCATACTNVDCSSGGEFCSISWARNSSSCVIGTGC